MKIKIVLTYVFIISLIVLFAGLLCFHDPAQNLLPSNSDKPLNENRMNPSVNISANVIEKVSYDNLGTKNLFKAIIPTPTPIVVPPTPTPEPPEFTQAWNLISLTDKQAGFVNKFNKEEFTLSINEKKEIQYKNQTYFVKLESINMEEFSASLSDNGRKIKKQIRF